MRYMRYNIFGNKNSIVFAGILYSKVKVPACNISSQSKYDCCSITAKKKKSSRLFLKFMMTAALAKHTVIDCLKLSSNICCL